MDWSQDILHLNSKFECWKYPAYLSPGVSTSIRTYTHDKCVSAEIAVLCVSPDKDATIPSACHHFLFLFSLFFFLSSPDSRNYSANGISLNSDICVTKGIWTCHDNCRQRTLRLGEPQGSIFAPRLNVCVSKSPTANFLWRSLKGRVMGCCVELLSCKVDTLLQHNLLMKEFEKTWLNYCILAVDQRPLQKAFKICYKQDFHDNFFQISHHKDHASLNTHVKISGVLSSGRLLFFLGRSSISRGGVTSKSSLSEWHFVLSS